MEHLRPKLSDLKQKRYQVFIAKELYKTLDRLLKKYWESKFKIPDVEGEEEVGKKKTIALKETLTENSKN